MARNTVVEKSTNKAGLFQWLLVIIVPLIFAITIALIILTFTGVDVIGKAKTFANHVPILSSVVTTEDEQEENAQIEKLEAEISSQTTEIDQLSAEVHEKDQTIDSLNQEIVKLTKQLDDFDLSNQEQTKTVENITTSFKDMEPETAAAIISNLDDDLATTILKSLPNKNRGQFLGAMDPELAARLTKALLQQSE